MLFGILKVSETCVNKETEDVYNSRLAEAINTDFIGSRIISKVVPDDTEDVKFQIIYWCDLGCDAIFIIGGTGFSPQNVIPEETRKVIEKETSKLEHAMFSKNLILTERMTTRSFCGIRKKTFIINLPGIPERAVDCCAFIKNILRDVVAFIKETQDVISPLYNQLHISSPSKVKLNNVSNKPRKSNYTLKVNDAYDIMIREICCSLETEVIPSIKSINRVLAEDVYAHKPVPPIPVSIISGYAVKCSDRQINRIVRPGKADEAANVTGPNGEAVRSSLYTVGSAREYEIESESEGESEDINAKYSQDELQSGEAFQVSTGTPIPPGADAVIPNDTMSIKKKICSDGKIEIAVTEYPTYCQFIKDVGTDIKANSLVLNKFDIITPAHREVLAIVKNKVKVFKRPSIAVISTGNEVKYPRELEQIPDFNKITLLNFLRKYSFDPVYCGIIGGHPDEIKSAFEKTFSNYDVVITFGNASTISTEDFDILKQVLIEDFSALIHFESIDMEPGYSTTFATLKYNRNVKYFFWLPASPQSCIVASIIFIIPALRYMERSKNYKFPVVTAKCRGILGPSSGEYRKTNYEIVSVSSAEDNKLRFVPVSSINNPLNGMIHGNGLVSFSRRTGNDYPVILFHSITY